MNIFQTIFGFLKTRILSDIQKDFEIAALRSQLALFQQQRINGEISKPRCNNAFRWLWVFLLRHFPAWKDALIFFKPKTIIGWHKSGYRAFWRRKSNKGSRPRISHKTIALIKRLHKENPLLSSEKIHERLLILNITDAPVPHTISKYIKPVKPAPSPKQGQSWQIFLRNHVSGIWAMDFAVVATINFRILYILVIVSHARRKIEHFAVTEHPTAEWVTQQLRNAMPFGHQPEYLIHDNDSIFVDKKLQQFLVNANIKVKRTGYHRPKENSICERLIGILRRELLDHIVPLNNRHLERMLEEYIYYYNHIRTHQALGGETPVPRDKPEATSAGNTVLKSKPILGGLYCDYEKVA